MQASHSSFSVEQIKEILGTLKDAFDNPNKVQSTPNQDVSIVVVPPLYAVMIFGNTIFAWDYTTGRASEFLSTSRDDPITDYDANDYVVFDAKWVPTQHVTLANFLKTADVPLGATETARIDKWTKFRLIWLYENAPFTEGVDPDGGDEWQRGGNFGYVINLDDPSESEWGVASNFPMSGENLNQVIERHNVGIRDMIDLMSDGGRMSVTVIGPDGVTELSPEVASEFLMRDVN